VTLAPGATSYLGLSTSAFGANDEVDVSGILTANNNSIHISAPSVSSSLDTTSDYTLITAGGGITGTFAAAPIWDVRPVNAGHYTIVTGASTVTLHYNASLTAPTVVASINPTTLTANQTTKVTAVVTPGSPGTVNGVSIDLSPIGGVVQALVQSNSSTTWTNTITIPPTAAPGGATLNVTVTDTASESGSTTVGLTISTTGETWNGAGGNENWTTGGNWVGGSAPAYSGDPLLFQGSAGPAPNMNTNYTIPTLTFSNNAGSFNIGSTTGSTLTINGSGTNIVNNSTSAQTLNVSIADAGNGLTVAGGGGVTLAGSNTYTGPTIVSAGTLGITGTSGSLIANATVGSAAGDAELKVSGSGSLTASNLFVGNLNNSAAAVYQTGGTATVTGTGGADDLDVGNIAGSYGYYDAAGGILTVNGICVGGENSSGVGGFGGVGGSGIMDVNGGIVTNSGWVVLSRDNAAGSTEIGILNVYAGLLTYAGGGIVGPWDTGEQANVNIMGGVVSNTTATVGVQLGNTGFLGNLNLNGGVLEAGVIDGYNGPSFTPVTAGRLSFNGGTLEASQGNGGFIAVTSAYIYSGGATINNNGFGIATANPLLAPTGNGVNGIAFFTGGAGYIAPPIVTITNGAGDTTGFGATAIAQINPATGTLTNVLITCPGVNYTATPVFTVMGGGATTPATITGAAPTANTSGGLTSTGGGVLTLSGLNTYTGNTTVSGGTLELATANLNSNSTVTVASGAVLQLDAATTNKVAVLVLNGTSEPVGLYNSTSGAPYITGAGTLQVTGAVVQRPTITGVSLSGTNVVFTGINGLSGENYNILTSTNVAAPLSSWTVLPMGTFSSGNFTITNGVNTNSRQNFYLIRIP